jgi:fucose 4-O-acetylase-like acetyltransferase
MLITFGKNSIVIYIIHFTMLFSLYDLLSIINLGQTHYLVFTIGLIVAIIISYSCVFIGNIFKQLPLLDGLIFGRWKFKIEK